MVLLFVGLEKGELDIRSSDNSRTAMTITNYRLYIGIFLLVKEVLFREWN